MTTATYNVATTDENTGFRVMTGWNFRETAGASAIVQIRDGATDGPIVVSIALAANESAGEQYITPLRANGVTDTFFYDVTGTVEGAVYGWVV